LYKNADEWREVAMERAVCIEMSEQNKRRLQAEQHQASEGDGVSEDVQQDYELYIQGKMDLEEYQSYLLYKHTK